MIGKHTRILSNDKDCKEVIKSIPMKYLLKKTHQQNIWTAEHVTHIHTMSIYRLDNIYNSWTVCIDEIIRI